MCSVLRRLKFWSNIIHTFSTEWKAMVVEYGIVLHGIIYTSMSILASLTQPKQIRTLQYEMI